MAEHTPTTECVREFYVKVQASVLIDGDWEAKEAEFDRWLAAHEQQLRERIAAEIEKHVAEHDAPWNGALDLAAEIARGDGR